MVENQGYEVIIVSNGMEGIEKVCVQKLDLIFMDVVMLELNGFQVICKIIKDVELGVILVILVIIKDQEIDKVWGECQGVVGYIVKLVQELELVVMIKCVLG